MKLLPKKLYYKIREVCEIVGVEAHVLRFWETEFPPLAPPKSKNGQRTYRSRDIELILEIRKLLYEDGYTIAGARKHMGLSSALTGKKRMPGKAMRTSTHAAKPVKPSLPGRLPLFDFTCNETDANDPAGSYKGFMKAGAVVENKFRGVQPVPKRPAKAQSPENAAAAPKTGDVRNTTDLERLKRVQKELENILTLLDRE